ncbi:MAG: DUF3298 domain-containing protein [Desulfitobacteriaceae bacterium]|nr:DUF3298 domain-containing protein [Desulfitobacteriaceae bacterium]
MSNKVKEAYNCIPVATELPDVVSQALQRGRKIQRRRCTIKYMATLAAVFSLVFITLLNTTSVFAAAYEVPILGDICRIFTFNKIDLEDETKIINVKVPNIENTGNTALEHRINMEISKLISEEVEQAEKRAQEYYDAYLLTGGIPGDYLPLEVVIDYDMKCSDAEIVSFVIYKYETMASYYQENRFYNIDLESGRELTLRDLYGGNYREIVSALVEEGIAQLSKETKFYLFSDVVIEDLIDTNRHFYISSDKNVVVVFQKYEIAAGAAGQLEFTIGHIPEHSND